MNFVIKHLLIGIILGLTVSCKQQQSAVTYSGQNFAIESFEEEYARINFPDSVVTEEIVRIVSSIGFGENGKEVKPDTLSRFIKIELIDKALFDSKMATAVNYIVVDNAIRKKDSTLILPARDSTVVITDHRVDNETNSIYEYVGEVPFVNQYIVSGLYWETIDVTFIDKYTGRQTAVFGDIPFVSPDKKHIISIYANPYEPMSADLSLHRIRGKKVEPIFSVSFKYWMPHMDSAFYSKDGWLYIPVHHPSKYGTGTESSNPDFQYIRIKAL